MDVGWGRELRVLSHELRVGGRGVKESCELKVTGDAPLSAGAAMPAVSLSNPPVVTAVPAVVSSEDQPGANAADLSAGVPEAAPSVPVDEVVLTEQNPPLSETPGGVSRCLRTQYPVLRRK
jgi:hypothetical protein